MSSTHVLPPPHTQPASAPVRSLKLVPPSINDLEHRAFLTVHRGPHDKTIAKEALSWKHDPHLLKGLFFKESGLKPKAENKETGARGLPQFTASGAAAAGRLQRQRGLKHVFSYAKAFDPEQAIPAAAELLRYLVDVCGGLASALAAYNTGSCRSYVPGFVLDVVRFTNQFRMESALPPIERPILKRTSKKRKPRLSTS